MPKLRGVSQDLIRRRWTEENAREVLAALAASGLPVSEFAAREGLDPQRLYGWRRRLTATPGPAFVELRTGDVARIEVVLRTGHVLRLAESFDPDALRRVLDVLEP